MAISTFPVSTAGGGGRTDLVFAPGEHTVDIPEGYYILDAVGDVVSDGTTLSSGFQKLPAITSLDVGVILLGTEWDLQSTGETFDLNEIAFNGTIYVISGESNDVLTSPDLSTWTLRTTPLSGFEYGFCLAFGAGQFIIGSRDAAMIGSADGINWTSRTSGFTGSERILGLVFADGLFVAVGGVFESSGIITTSTDGFSWTSRTSGLSDQLLDITYGDGLFIAVGRSGVLATSPDGINWTSRTSGFGIQDINSVTYGNGIYVIVGEQGKVSTSTDGITWTARDGDQGTTGINAVSFGNDVFILGGIGDFSRSTDGITWTSIPDEGLSARGFSFLDNAFIAAGEDGNYSTSEAGVNPNAALLLTELPEAIQP